MGALNTPEPSDTHLIPIWQPSDMFSQGGSSEDEVGEVLMLKAPEGADPHMVPDAIAAAVSSPCLHFTAVEMQRWRVLMRPFLVWRDPQQPSSHGAYVTLDYALAAHTITQVYGYDPMLGAKVTDSLRGLQPQKDGYVLCCTQESMQMCRGLVDTFSEVSLREIWEHTGRIDSSCGSSCFFEWTQAGRHKALGQTAGLQLKDIPPDEGFQWLMEPCETWASGWVLDLDPVQVLD